MEPELESMRHSLNRTLETENECTSSSSIETTWLSSTQAYGVMFTVKSKSTGVTITTLEFSAARIADAEVEVFVYTKIGNYVGYEDKPTSWVKVAEAKMVPAANTGTLIPRQLFTPVAMEAEEFRAFYVTLSTTDLKYANSEDMVGEEYATNSHLSVNVGAGVLDFPFSSFLFEPRLFTGRIHYSREVDCDSVLVDVVTSFIFLVQHQEDLSISRVTSLVNAGVGATIDSFMLTESRLSGFVEEFNLRLQSIESNLVNSFDVDRFSGCDSSGERRCSPIETTMIFRHSNDLRVGEFELELLSRHDRIVRSLNEGSLQVIYAGDMAIQTTLVISLEGVPSGQEMGAPQRRMFEEVTLEFLGEYAYLEAPATVLTVEVIAQDLYQLGSSTFLDATTVISGKHRPPPSVDFGEIIDTAILAHSREYLVDIVGIGQSPGFGPRDDLFTGVVGVSSTILGARGSESSSNSSSGAVILAVVLVIALMIVGILFTFFYRRKYSVKHIEVGQNNLEGEGDEDSQRGDYAAEIYMKSKSQHGGPIVHAEPIEQHRSALGREVDHSFMLSHADQSSAYTGMARTYADWETVLDPSAYGDRGQIPGYHEHPTLKAERRSYQFERERQNEYAMEPHVFRPEAISIRSGMAESRYLSGPQIQASRASPSVYTSRSSGRQGRRTPDGSNMSHERRAPTPSRRTPDREYRSSSRSRTPSRSPYGHLPKSPSRRHRDHQQSKSPFIPLNQREEHEEVGVSPGTRKFARTTPHPQSENKKRSLADSTARRASQAEHGAWSPERCRVQGGQPYQSGTMYAGGPTSPRKGKAYPKSPAPVSNPKRKNEHGRIGVQDASSSDESSSSDSVSELPVQRRQQIPLQVETQPAGPILTENGSPLNIPQGTSEARAVSPITLGTFGSIPSASVAMTSIGMTKSTASS